ncbi:MAG: apolipoprotein N-acyltransferase [Nitrospinota bacterium]
MNFFSTNLTIGSNYYLKLQALLPILAAILFSLAFPDYQIGLLAWIAFVPLLISIIDQSLLKSSLFGLLFGTLFYIITIPWIINSIHNVAGVNLLLSILIFFILVIYLGSYSALFTFLVTFITKRFGFKLASILTPFIFVTTELFKTKMIHVAFPWGTVSQTQYKILPVIQAADLFGASFISFIIIGFNVVISYIIYNKFSLNKPFASIKAPLLIGLVLALILPIYGHFRLEQINNKNQQVEENLTIALIQGNIDQKIKWNPKYRSSQINHYIVSSKKFASLGAKLIIWPEAAIPYLFGNEPYYDNLIISLAKEEKIYLIFGSLADSGNKGSKRGDVINRAWLVTPDGRLQYYDKIHLVPFGEYVPFENLLFFIGKLSAAVGHITAGNKLNLLVGDPNIEMPPNDNSLRIANSLAIGIQICFEIIFPDYSRKLASMGANLLVNITNDSWFGVSDASEQSLAIATLRAVENRLFILRAAQTGISAIISSSGSIDESTTIFEEDAILASIPIQDITPTFFNRIGYLFESFCGLVTLIIVATCWQDILILFRLKD